MEDFLSLSLSLSAGVSRERISATCTFPKKIREQMFINLLCFLQHTREEQKESSQPHHFLFALIFSMERSLYERGIKATSAGKWEIREGGKRETYVCVYQVVEENGRKKKKNSANEPLSNVKFRRLGGTSTKVQDEGGEKKRSWICALKTKNFLK